MRRPSLSGSTAAAILATMAGWRYMTPSTMGPSRRLDVRIASAVIKVQASVRGSVQGATAGRKWSETQMPSHPVASRCAARSSTAGDES